MDKAQLLANRVLDKTEDVELKGVGTIRIRALSRYEMILAEKRYPEDMLKRERFILATAIVEPELTEEDVKVWQENSLPDEINHVANAINIMSGIASDSAKEAYKRVREE